MLAVVAALAVIVIAPGLNRSASAVSGATVTNPLVADGADPWMAWHEGNYYLAYTTWSSQMVMRKAPTVQGLKTAKPVVIWSDTTASRCCNFWAPEFHLLTGPDGRQHWYFTFTAGTNGTYDNQHTQVLESVGRDPMGPYTFRGRIFDRQHDTWAIDGSYLRLNGSLYYMWSAFDGPQNIYIAKMSNPWTLTGTRSLLSTPQYDWEKVGNPVNEAPVALQRGGKTYVFYSASLCHTPDYKLGRLTYTGGDPLNTDSWSKAAEPAFTRNDAGQAYGPGHNGFFTSPDGTEDWNVYHANAKSTDGCGRTRSTRIQKLTWAADGTPKLGTPVALGDAIGAPSGENAPMPVTTQVQQVAYNVVNIVSNKCLETTASARNDNANVAQHSCVADPAAAAAATQQWALDDNGDGTYRLINRNSRKALSVLGCGTRDGDNVVQAAWTGTACQSWKLTPTTNGYVRIDDATSGKTLDLANCGTGEDVDVRLWSWLGSGSPCQQWRLQPVGPVGINNVNSGKLVAADCAAADGAAVTLRFYAPDRCANWTFTPVTGAGYAVRNERGSCLGVANAATTDGAATDVRGCRTPSADQQWYLVPQPDGTIGLANVASGKYLDAYYCGIDDGTKLDQYPWFNNDCQRFRLTQLGPIEYPEPVGPTYPDPAVTKSAGPPTPGAGTTMTPSPSTPPSTRNPSTPSQSPSTSTPTTAGGGGAAGTLPTTGPRVALLAGGALALLAGGILIRVLTRRHHT